ncbi:MAG: hypothetical protein LQ347_004978 [Umbilicaria vellea]|nr:MAG: hypothetical protein LQ347_004978 [Umbilicaria vellea]
MASKITTLRWPQYRVQKGANYTQFLKTVFEYNHQRKDLMDKKVIEAQWIQLVNSNISDKRVRESLISLINKKDARQVWKTTYTLKGLVIRSVPRVENTSPVPIDGRITNIPIISKYDLERVDYIHFASIDLPRANQGRVFDRKTTDEAWHFHVQYIFDNWTRRKPTTFSSVLARSRSRAAKQYWANREAEAEAGEHEEVDKS